VFWIDEFKEYSGVRVESGSGKFLGNKNKNNNNKVAP